MNLLNDTIQVDRGQLGNYRISWVGTDGLPISMAYANFDDVLAFLIDNGFIPMPTT